VNLPDWTREPLVHFVGLGAIVYFALTWGGTPIDPSSRVISIDAEQKAQLAIGFERVMGRAPTDAELDVRIERHLREEVLYREALRLGLDQGDAVVRQRLVAKMDMSASAAAEIAEPDEATLRVWFEANRNQYAGSRSVSFAQQFFEDEQAAAAALVRQNAAKTGVDTGDPISLPRAMTKAPLHEVEARFGQQFANGLLALEPAQTWQGPIPSGFGWHIVRVTDRIQEKPDFATLRPVIANDWRSEQIKQRQQRAFDILRSAYRIDIAP